MKRKCDCGGAKCSGTHAHWCSSHEEMTDREAYEQLKEEFEKAIATSPNTFKTPVIGSPWIPKIGDFVQCKVFGMKGTIRAIDKYSSTVMLDTAAGSYFGWLNELEPIS